MEILAACNQDNFYFSFASKYSYGPYVLFICHIQFYTGNDDYLFLPVKQQPVNQGKKSSSLVEKRAALVAVAIVSLTLTAILRINSSPFA